MTAFKPYLTQEIGPAPLPRLTAEEQNTVEQVNAVISRSSEITDCGPMPLEADDLYWIGKYIVHYSEVDGICRRLLGLFGHLFADKNLKRWSSHAQDTQVVPLLAGVIRHFHSNREETNLDPIEVESFRGFAELRNVLAHYTLHLLPRYDCFFAWTFSAAAMKKKRLPLEENKFLFRIVCRSELTRFALHAEQSVHWLGTEMQQVMMRFDPLNERSQA